jgi:hypothetical protein
MNNAPQIPKDQGKIPRKDHHVQFNTRKVPSPNMRIPQKPKETKEETKEEIKIPLQPRDIKHTSFKTKVEEVVDEEDEDSESDLDAEIADELKELEELEVNGEEDDDTDEEDDE